MSIMFTNTGRNALKRVIWPKMNSLFRNKCKKTGLIFSKKNDTLEWNPLLLLTIVLQKNTQKLFVHEKILHEEILTLSYLLWEIFF